MWLGPRTVGRSNAQTNIWERFEGVFDQKRLEVDMEVT